jgi:hypothetical protein
MIARSSRAANSAGRLILIVLAAFLALPLGLVDVVEARDPSNPRDFFGMVGRDPWYEFSTDPERYPNSLNRTFLETTMADKAELGVGWVRIEFHAENDQPVGPGWVDWSKHDWFINELAPKYGIKVLLLLGSGVLVDLDETYKFHRINDRPDSQGRNHYTRTYVERVREIAERYGTNVAAYEILNEPNANQILDWETDGEMSEVNPLIYGRLAVDTYEAIKGVNPAIQVIAGSMLYRPRPGGYQHVDWMYNVYDSPAVKAFVNQHGRHPWDGIAIHPYFLTPPEIVTHLNEFRGLQGSFGDSTGVWVTEVGFRGAPPPWSSYGIMDPTESELEQAQFLHDVYTLLRDQTPYVTRVFWFKYEDFGAGTYHNWGLVRLRDANFRYSPNGSPWPRKYAYGVYQQLARPERLPTAPQGPPADEGPRVRYFPHTGQTLRDPFLSYWEQHGGLDMFGYPKTRVFFVRGRPVQYFERARFEYWPEHKGTPWEVQLGLLGRYVTRHVTFDPQPPPESPSTNGSWTYFPQTGQYLAFGFKSYWEQNGGLDIFGYPISPEIQEVNPADGQVYAVQYFERARFEWHPEHRGTRYEVQLGLLGNQVLAAPGWYR